MARAGRDRRAGRRCCLVRLSMVNRVKPGRSAGWYAQSMDAMAVEAGGWHAQGMDAMGVEALTMRSAATQRPPEAPRPSHPCSERATLPRRRSALHLRPGEAA